MYNYRSNRSKSHKSNCHMCLLHFCFCFVFPHKHLLHCLSSYGFRLLQYNFAYMCSCPSMNPMNHKSNCRMCLLHFCFCFVFLHTLRLHYRYSSCFRLLQYKIVYMCSCQSMNPMNRMSNCRMCLLHFCFCFVFPHKHLLHCLSSYGFRSSPCSSEYSCIRCYSNRCKNNCRKYLLPCGFCYLHRHL